MTKTKGRNEVLGTFLPFDEIEERED
ncbi:hypothetical protein BB14905_18180 [Bacillus sp. B14905]|nr:hypothetical protein BB14905_18180 [Bacillus sp. B14905]